MRKVMFSIVLSLIATGNVCSPARNVSVTSITPAQGISSALAQTPPMGWNSWNAFGCAINEELVKGAADAIVAGGMRDAGYRYVVIDDCWQAERDAAGNIVADANRFPSGMKALADYVHSKGLLFGLYSDAGDKTCAGRPGSWGHEYQDAVQYAAWEVDYLKYDWCNTGTQDARTSYKLIRNALDATGRPIVLSICEWGVNRPWLWGRSIGGNLWRTTGDIQDRWEGKGKWADGSCCNYGVMDIVDMQVGLEDYAGPGHWNDPDMLEVGNGGMTNTEYRAHFSLWSMLAAPLMAGNDLNNMTPDAKEILTNNEIIAVDQDPLGIQGRRTRKNGDLEVWMRPLADGSRAVILLNRGSTETRMSLIWSDIGYPANLSANVRDLWAHRDLGTFAGEISASVASHGVVMFTVRP